MGSKYEKPANAAEIDRLALIVAKEPGSKAFLSLAEEYGKAGMWEEAAAVLEDGLKTYPNFITAMVALGRAYDQLGQSVKATAILEEAVRVSPENLRAHRTLAKIYAAQGRKEAAVRSCRVILEVNPQDQEALSICALLGVPSVEAEKERSFRRSGQASVMSVAKTTSKEENRSSAVVDQVHEGENSSDEPGASLERKKIVAARLEQWLAAIQLRRRDQRAANGQTV
ncbi:MAG: tetratricopeptide repeat protein [Nitrospira sp.]|nr:tetratricopeptide repeat protein [Nitrospira sp.]MCP9462312.1 tetratricopeptide repeat protein [Nitrospira sp.]MCP9474636.1 tetratricopeptide repeat protein [Nitrospira sp.]